ncbi:MAG: hypothetical protein ABSH19_09285, partial [Opitutales bacterium]
MKWLWISGWAVPPTWFAAQVRRFWPAGEHAAVAPHDAAAAIDAGDFHALGGYSLGTLWLLRHAHRVPKNLPVFLFAPIFAFPAEANLGGRIPRAQLRAQRRQFRHDAAAALLQFAQLSGLAALNIPTPPDELSAAHLAALDTGLGWLEDWTAPAPPPAGWRGWAGDADPLLDSARLRTLWPSLHLVPGAGHSPGPLLQAAAAE